MQLIWNWHELNKSTMEQISRTNNMFKDYKKPVPSLIPNVDLSIKKIQVFISNTRSI